MFKKLVRLLFISLLVSSAVTYVFAPGIDELCLRTPKEGAVIPVEASLNIVTDNLKNVDFLAGQVELTVTIRDPQRNIIKTSKRTLTLK